MYSQDSHGFMIMTDGTTNGVDWTLVARTINQKRAIVKLYFLFPPASLFWMDFILDLTVQRLGACITVYQLGLRD